MTEGIVVKNKKVCIRKNRDFDVEITFNRDITELGDVFFDPEDVLDFFENTRKYEQKINDPTFHFGAEELEKIASYLKSAIITPDLLKRIYIINRRSEYVVFEDNLVTEVRARVNGHYISKSKSSLKYFWQESLTYDYEYCCTINRDGYFKVFDENRNVTFGDKQKGIVNDIRVFKEIFKL